jgi:hypothetical protein
MATTYNTQIQQLYVAYFNRPADTAGLAFWEGVVEAANGDTSAVSAAFAASTEYKAAYANMTNSAIVTAVYQNLFGHAPDAAGLAFWAGNMDAGKLTIDAVVANVSKGALGTDATIFNNKVTAAATFTAALDTTAEQNGYTGDKANVLAKAFIAGVTDDASLSASIDPAALNTAVGKVVAASGVFDIASALSSYNAAADAETAFLATVDDGSSGATHNATSATVAANLATATTAIHNALEAAVTGNGTVYDNGTPAMKAALVSDLIAANASALATAQATLTADNAKVAAVAGLQSAIDTLTAATTAKTAAHAAATTADAAMAAQQASFGVTASTTTYTAANSTTDGTITVPVSGVTTTLATIDHTTGVATIATGIDATKYAGLTSFVTAINADASAHSAAAKADAAVTTAQLNVDHLDVDTSTTAEATTLAAVATDIKGYGDMTLATNVMPTEAQIATEQAILTAKAAAAGNTGAAQTAMTNFNTDVGNYHTASASNPLVDKVGIDSAAVTAKAKAVTDFNTDVATLATAQANVAELAGHDAAITAANTLFSDNGFNLVSLGTTVAAVAGTTSDVFVAGSVDSTISLFNLQGTDSLFIGTGYTLNTGKLTTGNDAVLEAFVGSDSSGNATITLENHAYSSHVGGAAELVKITLVGVDASTIHLDSNGIITAGPHA